MELQEVYWPRERRRISAVPFRQRRTNRQKLAPRPDSRSALFYDPVHLIELGI